MNIILFENENEDEKILKSDYRSRHILNILHLGEGDEFKMGIINKSQGKAQIISIDDKYITLKYTAEEIPSAFPVVLIVAQVRPICMKRILREAVCLGVEKIIITGADTTEKSYSKAKIWQEDQYREFLLAGAMQSGTAFIPPVILASGVSEAVKTDDSLVKIILDNRGSKVSGFSNVAFTKDRTSLAIGPERGWSDRERDIFAQNGYQCFKMGNRIMRTETAVPASISLLLSGMGLM